MTVPCQGAEAPSAREGLCGVNRVKSAEVPTNVKEVVARFVLTSPGKARKPSAVSPVKRAIQALDQLMGEADTEDRRPALVRASGWGLPLAGASATCYSLYGESPSRDVDDLPNISSASRASPAVFSPHWWQVCLGQVCLPPSPSGAGGVSVPSCTQEGRSGWAV
jgi:hypothetical protein